MEASGPPPAEGPLAITYEEGLPVEQVCDLADTHLAARLQVAASAEGLDKLAQQFRWVHGPSCVGVGGVVDAAR